MTPFGMSRATISVVSAAEAIMAEAASAARIDEIRRDFDAAVEAHCLRFGFDTAGEVAA